MCSCSFYELRVNDIVLKKKTSFRKNSPKKLQHHLVIDAYIIIGRIATNAFRVESLVTGEIKVMPGDSLVKLSGHDAESAKRLVARMEEVAMRGDGVYELPETRASARARGSTADDNAVSSATLARDNLSNSHRLFSIGKARADSIFDETSDYVLIL